ncbi:MAG: BMP family ABC transporter substrate-binding protein, partial [Acidimicrobiia bacterium]|nr:BMP family ABC transporter substrate-binding protein [Acidimicrobiia bacterium]
PTETTAAEEPTETTAAEEPTETTAAEEPTETTAAEEPTETTAAEEPTETTVAGMEQAPEGTEAIRACQVTDVGGIDDASFNQTAYKGVTDAVEAGWATEDSTYLESQAPADYAPNIDAFIAEECDLIVTVGFLLADATAAAAEASPDQNFEILDNAYDPPIDNVVGATFATTEAAFLAGYLAAGVSETGVVATYGGIQIPCAVTCFMDGFVYGVRHYNNVNGTDVQVLGWDPEQQTGVFTEDFENLQLGADRTRAFVDEGADVVLPVAGPVGEGSATVAQELGNLMVVGVDADWTETLPQYSDVILTSVLKGLDVAVFEVIQDVANGEFQGGNREFTIEENGVGLGTIHESVDQALLDELAEIEAGVKDGSIDPVVPPPG